METAVANVVSKDELMQEWGGLLNPLKLTGCLMKRQQSSEETTLCEDRDTGTTPCEDTEQCYVRLDSQNNAVWARYMGTMLYDDRDMGTVPCEDRRDQG